MKELIKPILLLVIVSLVSFYFTSNLIFPAYLISVPLTILFLTESIYCNFRIVFPRKDGIFFVNIYPLSIIAFFLSVQIQLPFFFFASYDDIIRPTTLAYGVLKSTYFLVIYFSFLALALFDCFEDGKMILNRGERKFASNADSHEEFYQNLLKILIFYPVSLWLIGLCLIMILLIPIKIFLQ